MKSRVVDLFDKSVKDEKKRAKVQPKAEGLTLTEGAMLDRLRQLARNEESGWHDGFVESNMLLPDLLKTTTPEEFDAKWLKVLQAHKYNPTDMSKEEWHDLTGGAKRLGGNGIYVLDVIFVNLHPKFYWPTFLYKDGMSCFLDAMTSPMFRGPGGFLLCRYAARSIDTGERYIPFKTGAPPPLA
ncbi:MAG: hypothetical protein ISN29_05075 [Gammaproteobacteria bacterium AqS3]|nr:hypothetical protein [Gammaproteobacteria bacterium AqS3]